MGNRYIFIVGLPRTGTKLMQSVLSANTDILCRLTPETWYLGDLFRAGVVKSIRELGDMSDDANIDRLLQLMYAREFRGSYWNMLGGKYLDVPPEVMAALLKASDRSSRGIYDAILRAPVVASHGAEAAQDAVLGDKMPGNLYHVPQLLEWFPNAQIVHMFRDPRAILASEWRKLNNRRPGGRVSALAQPAMRLAVVSYITVTWLYAVRLHQRYSQRYPDHYRLVRYEDLVGEPENAVRELCDSIKFDFNESMLQPAKYGSSFSDNGGRGFNHEAIDRWREHLPAWMRMLLNLVTGPSLPRFGYRR